MAFQGTNQAGNASNAGPPATAGFVTKLNTNDAGLNQVRYSTYFSGKGTQINTGFGNLGIGEAIVDMALSGGKVFITGISASTTGVVGSSGGFPLSANACQTTSTSGPNKGVMLDGFTVPVTAFVAELDPTALPASQLLFSRFLGGSGQLDGAVGIKVDSQGLIYVSGFTYSTDFPVTSTAFQGSNNASNAMASPNQLTSGFLTVLDPNGSGCSLTVATATPTATPSAGRPRPRDRNRDCDRNRDGHRRHTESDADRNRDRDSDVDIKRIGNTYCHCNQRRRPPRPRQLRPRRQLQPRPTTPTATPTPSTPS